MKREVQRGMNKSVSEVQVKREVQRGMNKSVSEVKVKREVQRGTKADVSAHSAHTQTHSRLHLQML